MAIAQILVFLLLAIASAKEVDIGEKCDGNTNTCSMAKNLFCVKGQCCAYTAKTPCTKDTDCCFYNSNAKEKGRKCNKDTKACEGCLAPGARTRSSQRPECCVGTPDSTEVKVGEYDYECPRTDAGKPCLGGSKAKGACKKAKCPLNGVCP